MHNQELFTSKTYRPLSARMRPKSLEEFAGQAHLLGKDMLLPKLIKKNCFGSIIFCGPPGCGKTTLAEIIAHETGAKCVKINAVMSNVAELKDILKLARYEANEQTILFIDEIHRFNKAQQDLLLPDVESGAIRLIGATTHNPQFYINPPLLSRSHLFRLEPLTQENIVTVLRNCMNDATKGLGGGKYHIAEEVLAGIARLSEGDLRRALNALETLVLSHPLGAHIKEEALEAFARERHIRYDANEDEHYDTISAFIKSMRGNDPDAALYWLAKMLEGGEDPRFIARRLVIFASEDVGLADSRALPLATAAFQACEFIGMPECALNLSHATIFLATAPKSNSATLGIMEARAAIKSGPVQTVPLWLRDDRSKVGHNDGSSKEYRYSHNYKENISGQSYMLEPKEFYHPKEAGTESSIKERLAYWKSMKSIIDFGN